MTTSGEQVDHYATLGLPHTAALDEPALQRAYTEHSRAAHPDHGGSETRAAQVNAAYHTLGHTEKRLKHLLELSGPSEATAWRTVPLDDSMMRLFSSLGQAMESSAKFLERKVKASSALAKAVLTAEEMQHREALERMGTEIEERKQGMETHLPTLDTALAGGEVSAWKELAAMQARFAYLAKWQAQVRERLLALM